MQFPEHVWPIWYLFMYHYSAHLAQSGVKQLAHCLCDRRQSIIEELLHLNNVEHESEHELEHKPAVWLNFGSEFGKLYGISSPVLHAHCAQRSKVMLF